MPQAMVNCEAAIRTSSAIYLAEILRRMALIVTLQHPDVPGILAGCRSKDALWSGW